jgi:hypothetical protein
VAVYGSEEEARRKIYSVSTRCYYAFGALVPEEVSYKIKGISAFKKGRLRRGQGMTLTFPMMKTDPHTLK